jgi:hypothetical protein
MVGRAAGTGSGEGAGGGCRTPEEILRALRREKAGHVRDAAFAFLSEFRVPVRDQFVDAVLAVRRAHDTGVAVEPEILELADAASVKETCLAALVGEAEIRDAVRRMAAWLNAQDEASGRPPFSWLGRSGEVRDG